MTIFVLGLVVAASWIAVGIASFDGWQHGDWLINYSGGLVRRGAAGTDIRSVFGEGSLTALTLLQSGLLTVLYGSVAALFLTTRGESAWFMAVLSPAVLLFPLLGIGGAFRKEIIVLATIGLMSVSVAYRRSQLAFVLLLPFYVVGVLSHELAALVLPAIIWLIRFANASHGAISTRRMKILIGMYSAISAVGLVVAVLRPGSYEHQKEICASWATIDLVTCDSGALVALSGDLSGAIADVLGRFPSYSLYAISAVLAALPLALVGFLRYHWRISVIITLCAVPLFISAVDWGRWIYICATTLTLLALVSNASEPSVVRRVPRLLAGAYVLLWSVPWYGQGLAEGLIIRLGMAAVDRLVN